MSIHTKSEKIPSASKRITDDALLENWHFFLYQTFARLKNTFSELAISQDELSARLGKDKAFVSRSLQGQSNMTLKTMYKIARALGYRMEIDFVDLKDVSRINRKYVELGQSNFRPPVAATSTWITKNINVAIGSMNSTISAGATR